MCEPPRRIARRLGLDRNPLRRPSDRVETSLTLAVVLVVLTLGPLLVWRVAEAGYRDAVSAADRDRRHRPVEVPAVLLDDAAKYPAGTAEVPGQGPVPARWTAPDGTVCLGSVIPPADARSGSTVPVSVDARGNLVQPPVSPDPAGFAFSLGFAVATGLLGAGAGVLALARGILNRRRMRDWQRRWLLVERQWSGRR
jgi:hypothetical protein